MDYKLCRREKPTPSSYCAQPIKTPNALNWCDPCRVGLPFWPASDPAPTPPQLMEVAPTR